MAVMDVKRLIPATRVERYDVVNPGGEDLGQVQNFMIDPETGKIAFVVASFGGMLGVSDKWFAIPIEVLRWDIAKKKFIMDVSRETLEKAPGLDKDRWPEEFDLTWLEGVYTCFGCAPYWAGGARWVPKEGAGVETLVVAASWLKAHELKNKAGENIGKIEDLIIDLQSGCLAYAVVSPTGYEEIRERRLSVPLEAFSIETDAETMHLDVEKEKLDNAPVFMAEKLRQNHDILGEVYSYYGYSPYWENRSIWRRRGTPVHPFEPVSSYQPDLYSTTDLLGDPVRDIQGNDAGKMDDLMIDLETGVLASAIISAAATSGMGDKLYPMPLEVLSFDPVNKIFYLSVDRETIEEAPAFDRDRLPKVDRQGLVDVYAAYGYTPYWRERKTETEKGEARMA